MGNTVGAPIVVSEYLEDEIGPIVFKNSLGNARFLKTVKAYHSEEGYVVVKIYRKRNTKETLEKIKIMLIEIKNSFTIVSGLNIMPYQQFIETERSGYLIRQYFHNNLYDRLSTRPFLSMIEKKFIAFQLLKALEQSSFKGIFHGDIKCENIMVTTTNWVYLVDFACYKPTFIPEDNPADFSFYFDTSGRRTCYIAPERFYDTNKAIPIGELTPKMDIFSLGCVIAELFLDGFPIFDFSQLLSYRKGEYSPEPIIRQRINDPNIQSLILHMIQKDPDQRYTPEKYIVKWTENEAFPAYFSFAHSFIPELMRLENDDRVMCICDKFDEIVQIFKTTNSSGLRNSSTSNTSSGSGTPLRSSLQNSPTILHQQPNYQQQSNLNNYGSNNNLADQFNLNNNNNNNNSSRQPINKLEDIGKNIANIVYKTEKFITEAEEYERIDITNLKDTDTQLKLQQQQQQQQQTNNSSNSNNNNNRLNQQQELKKIQTQQILKKQQQQQLYQQQQQDNEVKNLEKVDGLDLFLSIIFSAVKHCQYPSTKVKCVGSLLVRMAELSDDECRLQKIVPYIMSMISTEQPTLVRVQALRSLAKVLEMVQCFPPSESSIFSQYILPSLSQLSHEQTDELIRIAFAEILPQLATTAKRFLEIAQHYRDPDLPAEGMISMGGASSSSSTALSTSTSSRDQHRKFRVYDSDLQDVQEQFFHKVSDLLTKDSCNTLKKIILSDIYRLCVFFGRQKTNESVLPLIITFLNDRDWQLRCAFFENIVAVCTVVGAGSLESFIYPCILLALTDEEEFVTEKALSSLSELCSLGLLRKPILLELLVKTSPMLLHPNNWIRYGVVSLIVKICSSLSKADLYCYVKPKLSPYLVGNGEISDNISESNLIQLLDTPISRDSFNRITRFIYKYQINLSSSSLNLINDDNNDMTGNNSNIQSGGSNRRLRALSKKIFIPNLLSQSNVSINNSNGFESNYSGLLSNSTEESLAFQRHMTTLGISDLDQIKIIKCFDYLQSKKCKDIEIVGGGLSVFNNNNMLGNLSLYRSNSPTNLSNSITIGGSGGVSNNSSVGSNLSSLNSSNNLQSSLSTSAMGGGSGNRNNGSPTLQGLSGSIASMSLSTSLNSKLSNDPVVEITKLPSSIPIRMVKIRGNEASSLNNSSTSITSPPSQQQQGQQNSNVTSSSNAMTIPTNTSSSLTSPNNNTNSLSTTPSSSSSSSTTNQLSQSNPNQTISSTSNLNSPNTNTTQSQPNTTASQTPILQQQQQIQQNQQYQQYQQQQYQQYQQLQQQPQQSIQSGSNKIDIVSPQDLNVVTKKYTINTKNTFSLSQILKVDTIVECSIKAPPPLPDLGSTDSTMSIGGSGGNQSGASNSSNIGVSIGGSSSSSSSNASISNTSQSIHHSSSSGMGNQMGNLYTAFESSNVSQWRPMGVLVSHFFEHKAAVNEIQVSSDNLFFATASNDGSVKIWDCQRMEKSVTNRARQTYTQQDGRITSISICEKTHSIASASDKGSIHVFRVGINGKLKGGNVKYTNLSTIKNISEINRGNIVSVSHFATNSSSVVTYATTKGGIHGWDLRSQQDAFNLVNDPSLGLIQCFLIDPHRNWLVTGTSRGFLTCWDLRFGIPLYNFRVSNGRILKLSPYMGSKQSSESWIHISTELDNVIVFDLANRKVTRVFKRSYEQQIIQQQINQQNQQYQQQPQPSTPTSSSLSSTNLSTSQTSFDFGTENLRSNQRSNSFSQQQPNNIVNSLNSNSNMSSSVIGNIGGSNSGFKPTPIVRALLNPPNCQFLITAGDDKRIKLWDWNNLPQSYYVSIGKEPPPFYTHRFSNDTKAAFEIHEEIWHDSSSSSYYTNTLQSFNSMSSSLSGSGNNSGGGSGSSSSSSSSSSLSQQQQQYQLQQQQQQQQQQYLNQLQQQKSKSSISMPSIHHLEPILDIKMMEVPNPMLISASTDGVVKVWK